MSPTTLLRQHSQQDALLSVGHPEPGMPSSSIALYILLSV